MNEGPPENSSAVELTLNVLQPDCFGQFHVYTHVLFYSSRLYSPFCQRVFKLNFKQKTSPEE